MPCSSFPLTLNLYIIYLSSLIYLRLSLISISMSSVIKSYDCGCVLAFSIESLHELFPIINIEKQTFSFLLRVTTDCSLIGRWLHYINLFLITIEYCYVAFSLLVVYQNSLFC